MGTITTTTMTTITAMTTETRNSALPLQIWLSPAFPVGSFAYSHGLEWAVEEGDVRDAATLAGWIGGLVAHGAPRNDAILLAQAWRAAATRDVAGVGEVNELALALSGSSERLLETATQGTAFLTAIASAWPAPHLDACMKAAGAQTAYPVAVGIAAALHGISLEPTLEAYLVAWVGAIVSAAVRLGVIGQTDGQRTVADLVGDLRLRAVEAATATLDDLGTAAFRSDIAAMRHETQYSRLFRS